MASLDPLGESSSAVDRLIRRSLSFTANILGIMIMAMILTLISTPITCVWPCLEGSSEATSGSPRVPRVTSLNKIDQLPRRNPSKMLIRDYFDQYKNVIERLSNENSDPSDNVS